MKGVDMKPFHGSQNEYFYSHIGMGCDYLELLSCLHSANSSGFHPPDNRLDTLYNQTNYHQHSSVRRPKGQASPRYLSQNLSKIPLAAGSTAETVGKTAYQYLPSCWNNTAELRRYAVSSNRPKSSRCSMVARRGALDRKESCLLLGFEYCGLDFASNASLGRRTVGTSNQHETSPKEWRHFDRFGTSDAFGGCRLVSRKAVSGLWRWILRFACRAGSAAGTLDQPDASRCCHIRSAKGTKKKQKRSQTQERRKAADATRNGKASEILATGGNTRAWQEKGPSGLHKGSYMVQGFSKACVACNQPRPGRQREERLFLQHRYRTYRPGGNQYFCRLLEYRGHIQKYQAVHWGTRAADLEAQRAGTNGGDRLVAVFCDMGLVYPTWLQEKFLADEALVSFEGASEFSGCSGLLEKGSLAKTNYIDVRKTYRTCQNFRVPYRSPGFGSIINYEKCESSLLINELLLPYLTHNS